MPVNQQRALEMIELQNSINASIYETPDWVSRIGGVNLRSIILRIAKCMLVTSQGVSGEDQLLPLLVDILPTILTDFIVKARGNLPYAASALVSASKPHTGVTGTVCLDGQEFKLQGMAVQEKLELMIGLIVARRISLPLIESLLAESGSDWDDLCQRFMARHAKACVATGEALSLSGS